MDRRPLSGGKVSGNLMSIAFLWPDCLTQTADDAIVAAASVPPEASSPFDPVRIGLMLRADRTRCHGSPCGPARGGRM
jgi:hypothetical protein